MDVWVKLFEVDGHQLLVEKTTTWDDDREQDMPAMVFKTRAGGNEVKQSMAYEDKAIRDKAFVDLDKDGLAQYAKNWMRTMQKLLSDGD